MNAFRGLRVIWWFVPHTARNSIHEITRNLIKEALSANWPPGLAAGNSLPDARFTTCHYLVANGRVCIGVESAHLLLRTWPFESLFQFFCRERDAASLVMRNCRSFAGEIDRESFCEPAGRTIVT